jgi:hypothetical protein
MNADEMTQIPGYDYGKDGSSVSSLTDEELTQLEQTVGWTEEDAKVLRKYAELFRRHAEAMVDSWRAVIGSQPHLARCFVDAAGKPDDDYKARVKRRFVQWVVDVATRPHDRDWINYQEEIGLRHTPAKKNMTDNQNTPPLVPLRYLLGFVPVVLPVREFFTSEITSEDELNALECAWTRAVLLHVTLWAKAYTREGMW